ncbi:MAG: VCBS repeat-containing protein, partial [Ferruginibacter sp.]
MLNDSDTDKKKHLKRIRNILVVTLMLILFVGFPLLYFKDQTKRDVARQDENPLQKSKKVDISAGTSSQSIDSVGPRIDFFDAKPIGRKYTDSPQIANIATADLDRDGLLDVLVCDAKANTVSWIRQFPLGTFTESVVGSGFIAPAHVQACDFDKDGDLDIMVAVLGML